MSVIREVVTARLQSVWPLKQIMLCGLLPFLWCRYSKGPGTVGKRKQSPGGYTVLLLHLVTKKALSHHQV